VAPKTQFDPVPNPVAGPMTTKCDCGWEIVTIQPEESIQLLIMIFRHLKDHHGIEFPNICNFWH
jgi:hypothetical protein